ncbi:MAG: RNA-binding domain-containing protein [Candidatus Nitrosocosmicus sp.]
MDKVSNYTDSSPEVIVQTYVNPSEELEKVYVSIRNIFPNSKSMQKDNKIYFSTERFDELKKIKEQIKSRATLAVLKKVLYNNQNINTTFFLLNKQAAYSGVVAIIEEEEESPLGPIKITIKNQNIEEIIRWFEN